MTDGEAHQAVHGAIGGMLDDGEIAIGWTLTIDVVGPDQMRYLAHRAGGGADGSDKPTIWTALGTLRASMQCAEEQLREGTQDTDDDDAE